MKKRGQTENISWENLQDNLAEKHGLAIVLTDEDSSAVSQSNNNSMCRALYNSHEFAPECAEFCGRAFEWAQKAGETVEYKCYAGLNCKAVPLSENSAVIVGRTFLKAEDYRNATERAISGDWQTFAPTAFFENVLLNGSPKTLDALTGRLEKLSDDEKNALENFTTGGGENQSEELTKLAGRLRQSAELPEIAAQEITAQSIEESAEAAAWRSLFGSLLDLSYEKAYQSILQFLAKRYSMKDLAWLEGKLNRLETIFAVGRLDPKLQIKIAVDDRRLREAAQNRNSLEFVEKETETGSAPRKINLFAIAVGGEIGNALIVGDEIADQKTKKSIARFCDSVAPKIEILRLREEVSRRNLIERAVQKFNDNLKNIDAEDFWTRLAQISAELLRAERSSILLFDEKSETFSVKAAIGARAEIIKNEIEGIGARVATAVFQENKAVAVADVSKIGVRAAPLEWSYRSASFISYPITVGTRKIGVLNFTDASDGKIYCERDLELLNAIAPQFGVAIDRVTLKNEAKQLVELSVTDDLTGLLNRRYLQPRLEEEIKRSNRYGYPMSFVLIDIDDFGRFNKDFGVLVGDEVLRQAVKAMTSTLRGEDVAARYGGEEFCVLLPQTTLREAVAIAERMRQSVEKIDFPSRKITVSLGVTTFSHDISTSDTIIKSADDALRQAKQKGKNNVQVFENL